MTKKRVVILISGRGSNMKSLLDAASGANFPAHVVGVISNEAHAAGLEAARAAGVPTEVIDHRQFASRREFETAVDARLTKWKADLVCLAGFMRIISNYLISRWNDKIINIHPSMLPDYPGLRVHERVFADRKEYSGCTVHYVREKVDFGPGIVQARVPLEGCRTPEDVAARVLQFEHLIYPLAVRLICGDEIEVVDEKVYFRGEPERPAVSFDGGFNPLIVIDVRFRQQVQKRASKTDAERHAASQGYAAEVRKISSSKSMLYRAA